MNIKQLNKGVLLLAAGIIFWSAHATPQVDVTEEQNAPREKVVVINPGTDTWGLVFEIESKSDSNTKRNSAETEIDISNLETFTSTQDKLLRDLVFYMSHYYTSLTHHFSLTVANPAASDERKHRGYMFCVTAVDPKQGRLCKALNLAASQADFLRKLKDAGVKYEFSDGEHPKKKGVNQTSKKRDLTMSSFSLNGLDDNEIPDEEDDPVAEYERELTRELEEFCGYGEFCEDYGVASTYYESTGTWEVHGYYENYVDGTSDDNYKPRPFPNPIGSIDPPTTDKDPL